MLVHHGRERMHLGERVARLFQDRPLRRRREHEMRFELRIAAQHFKRANSVDHTRSPRDSDDDAPHPAMIPQRDRQASSTSAQTSATFTSESMTAALPRSLARFDRSWYSSDTRSTMASIAELISSTIRTRTRLPMRSARSVPFSPSIHPHGASTATAISSSRNAS